MKLHLILSASILAVTSASFAQQSDPAPAADMATAAAPSPVDEKAQRAAQAAAEKEKRAAAAAERKRMAELQRQYGAGPYPDEINGYLADKPEALRPLYKALFVGGERNAVLNFERLGLAAMDQGYWADAEHAFDGALLRIEAIYANNKQAEAARSVFHNEANKEFKGEPYERAMAYYYRGLLYLRAGDYDNARASFRSAEYQDTVSETETAKADFAVMNYLTGWTYHCQGGGSSADEAFAAARAAEPSLQAPAADDRVLAIAELGRGPVKARAGNQAQKLVFQQSSSISPLTASFDLGGPAPVAATQASSVYYQATTRGGRAIDGILQGKASFKDTTTGLGDAASQVGLMAAASGDMDAGLGFGGAGMLLGLLGGAAKTQADIRAWDTLPDAILVASAKPPAGELTAKVRYGATGDGVAPMMKATAGKCSIVWSRSDSSAGISPNVPGEDAGVAAAVARKPQIQLKDKAFRAALYSTSRGTALAAGSGK